MSRIEKIRNNLNRIKIELACFKDYTKQDIYCLWKNSGLTIDEVAEKLYRSPEQARKYCYGYIEGRQMRIKIADFFKEHEKINKKKEYEGTNRKFRKTLGKI